MYRLSSHGECLGLIGRNGAGKTTLLKMLNGLLKPDQGRIEIHGDLGANFAADRIQPNSDSSGKCLRKRCRTWIE